MKTRFDIHRTFAAALALLAATPTAQAAVLGTASEHSEALEQVGMPYELVPKAPAECETLRIQIRDLDEAIASHPEVIAVREAYDQSDLGRRERAATEAMNTEGCFARPTGAPTDTCLLLMQEIETCASAFENSTEFQRVQQLPEVIEINRLSDRFDDLCAATMSIYDDDCEWTCEDDYCDESDEDALPGTV